MPKETVLYIGGFELPDKNAAAHRVMNNAKILKALGKNVVFVGISHELPSATSVEASRQTYQGFESYALHYPKGKVQWLQFLLNTKDYIRLLKQGENVTHVIFYNFPAYAMFKLMKYCKKRGIRCIADITEWYSVDGENLLFRIVKGIDVHWRMKKLHKKMDGVIAISRYLEQYYASTVPTVYIPPLVDLKEDKWKTEGEKSDTELKLVYAGSPLGKDEIHLLVDALQIVNRPCRLDIMGITEEIFLQHFPLYQPVLEKNSKVVFHGRVAHKVALDYIKQANYSCFFRDTTRVTTAGFPTKFAEAITCETPVLTNASSNLSDYLDGKNGVLLKSMDPVEIAAAIENLPFRMRVEKETFDYHNFIDVLHEIV